MKHVYISAAAIVLVQPALGQRKSTAFTVASAAVAKLGSSEKVGILTGQGVFTANCTGATFSAPTIGFPGFCLQDSALGVRNAEGNSAFPAGINAAATFNRQLIYDRAVAMGAEFYGKGIHVQLGPMTNMMRAPAAGRNWEGFGGDPYLAGEATYQSVLGIQSQGVQATVKHWLNNEQEHVRMLSSSNVDDRTQHELYMHPFLKAIQAEVASVMCSYNQINGTYACENDQSLNKLLKGELGFRGYVMSDWLATHSTSKSANNGLDMDMPGGIASPFFGDALRLALAVGNVSEQRLTDMATRVLAAWYKLGQDKYPALNIDKGVQGDHASLIRKIAAASTVLLKNKGNALPLKSPKSIALIGSAAGPNPDGPNSCTDRTCNKGTLAMGWGSGTANFPYLSTPLDAITAKANTSGIVVTSSLSDDDLNAAAAATGKDVAFVFITADSGEAGNIVEWNDGDRNDLNAWHNGNALVQKVASVNKNTVVVANTVGPIIVDSWIDHVNVTGLVWAGLPGQEAGNSLVDILWGTVNPSGRLPYTIAKKDTDYAAKVDYTVITLSPVQIDYSEGLNIDYRHFDSANIAPRYEFGFGLSYTNFTYSGLSVSGSVGSYTPPYGNGSSLDASLHTNVYTVTASIRNSGSIAGTEIPQLYLTFPASANSPPYVLKGFDAISLNAGETKTVTFKLTRYDISVWSVVAQRWVIPSGTFKVTVGASSRDRRLTGTFTV